MQVCLSAGARIVAALAVLGAALSVPAIAHPALSGATDAAMVQASYRPAGALWAENLNLKAMIQGCGVAGSGRSVGGKPITLNGVVYYHGIGTSTPSQMTVSLKGTATRFRSMVGVDDEAGKTGSADFSVIVDGRTVADSGLLHGGDAPKLLTADLTGARYLRLQVLNGDGTDGAHADWGGAQITLVSGAGVRPQAIVLESQNDTAKIVPPDPRPAIHGPRVVGGSPRRPFLFLIPATGTPPLTYSAAHLPAGLTLDSHTGIISGAMTTPGTFSVDLAVSGPAGRGERALSIVCGDHQIGLTPPMGWTSWNILANTVTEARIREAADWMVKTGLAAHGYSYVNIGDTWEGGRDKKGNILYNRRFIDMKALADYVHGLGLKIGIYSAPSELTCSGFKGSLGHEQQDAASYAAWGMDYLQYDWCPDETMQAAAPPDMKAAYMLMGTALSKASRDIFYAVTTYGKGNPWDWAVTAGGNSWLSNPALFDDWTWLINDGFNQENFARIARPGHWNDPGLLMVGRIGFGNVHWSRLKPSEQMSQVSMWAMMAAPLILSCDLTRLDPNTFHPSTTALLTNDDVIDIDQDPRGQCAHKISDTAGMQVWVRPLWDGTVAVGLFNTQDAAHAMACPWSATGLSGAQPVRDIWQHQDLGPFTDQFTAVVPPHGVVLLRVGKPTLPAVVPAKA